MMEKQNITLKIANETFPLSITPSLEEPLRAAVDEINGQIREIQDANPDVPLSKILSIALLNEEMRLVEALNRNEGEYGKLLEEIRTLDRSLGDYLSR